MTSWHIIESELIEWLGSYDGPRFHAVLSDPPYALISITKRFGKDGSAPAQEGSDGRYSRLSGGFMGQKWDGFDSLEHYQTWVSEWAKLLIEKILHPGAVCLFFGGTRTFHHLGVGLERGGFEIVDCLMWLHGQGFPKSHDISKGLDKAADYKLHAAVRRAAVAAIEACGADLPSNSRWDWTIGKHAPGDKWWTRFQEWLPGLTDEDRERIEREIVATIQKTAGWFTSRDFYDITVPATPDAETWDGYGTALKPAWEPIFLCRAPRGDKTFAQLATEFGSGALNIDGGRISTNINLRGGRYSPPSSEGEADGSTYGSGINKRSRKEYQQPSGRWPANFILSHTDDCVKVGEFEVEGRTLNRYPSHGAGGSFAFYAEDHRGEDYQSEEMPPETVERWACMPGCPVRMLDDQAGELHSGFFSGHRNSDKTRDVYSAFKGTNEGQGRPASSGGPSRFFYTAKASRSEKDRGLEHFWWKRTDDGFERISLSEYEQLDKRERAHGCIHPTVKPLELLRYLSTLLLPPEQDGNPRRILMPFSGSGSEMIGVIQAGWDEVTGIETEQNYIEMAEARLRANIGML